MDTLTRATRKSVPLTEDEIALVQAVRTQGTPERAAIEAQVGPLPERVSEAQAIGALLALGAARVRDQVIHTSYATYAAALDDEDAAHERAVRSRRDRLTD